MKEILQQINYIIKAIGEKPMLELVKNWWIKFAIGAAIILLAIMPYLPDVIRAVQGR